jgi:hypothetical protein
MQESSPSDDRFPYVSLVSRAYLEFWTDLSALLACLCLTSQLDELSYLPEFSLTLSDRNLWESPIGNRWIQPPFSAIFPEKTLTDLGLYLVPVVNSGSPGSQLLGRTVKMRIPLFCSMTFRRQVRTNAPIQIPFDFSCSRLSYQMT